MLTKIIGMNWLCESGIMAAVRLPAMEKCLETAKALFAGGVKVIEFSMVMPGCLQAIRQVKNEMGDSIYLGIGTVLDGETAAAGILAGADFVTSPVVNEGIMKVAHRHGKLTAPGAMTPNEILAAYELGADIVKVFPGGILGADYIKGILAPLPNIPLMPDGGVTLQNAEELILAGSSALGVCSKLARIDLVQQNKFDEITRLAQSFIEKVKTAKIKRSKNV